MLHWEQSVTNHRTTWNGRCWRRYKRCEKLYEMHSSIDFSKCCKWFHVMSSNGCLWISLLNICWNRSNQETLQSTINCHVECGDVSGINLFEIYKTFQWFSIYWCWIFWNNILYCFKYINNFKKFTLICIFLLHQKSTSFLNRLKSFVQNITVS